MALSDFTTQYLQGPSDFNWPWFVELCVCGIITVFFLFYFNRLFATLLSYGIRAYAWHHFRVWVDIQALQISLLGGRIFFKGVRYHGENETIFVHNGYITWRYWFRAVRQVDLTTSESMRKDRDPATTSDNVSDTSNERSSQVDEEQGAPTGQKGSEARVAVFVTGLEWFIYNRTPLYDAILRDDATKKSEDEAPSDVGAKATSSDALKSHLRATLRRRPKSDETSSSEDSRLKTATSEKFEESGDNPLQSVDRHSTMSNEVASAEADVTALQSLLVQLLPLYIECSRAAVLMGNEHTKALLVTTFDKAKGHVDARGCGPHDFFQQVFDFDVEHPVIQMRPNPDYVGPQATVAEHFITDTDALSTRQRWWHLNMHLARRKYKAIHALRNLVPGLQSSVESLRHSRYEKHSAVSHAPFAEAEMDEGNWHGLSRYLDENDVDDHQAWGHIDYARFSTMVDCPSVHMKFYWDSPGRVKSDHIAFGRTNSFDDINGVKAPAYGMDLIIRGGTVNYGPWTDRLRAEIQQVFFPASYSSAMPARPLRPGQWRQCTTMLIRIDIEEEVTLRVPTKEPSKDWRWRGRATAVRDAAAMKKQREKRHFRLRRGQKTPLGPDVRPFGWISVSVSADSAVRYEMDLVAGSRGYRNELQLDLKNTRATSSVNHADLWRCANQSVRCDLSNPLVWNSQHTWHFDIQNQSMDMFLLRDHMFLLTDLIADFTAGQKASYMTFVPFEYKMGLQFSNLQLFLNANDFNIIDNPSDLESNTFLILGMHELKGSVEIPMHYFSLSQSSVYFRANGSDLFLDLKTPVWNTLHSFAQDENMATLKKLELGGAYNYNAGTSAQLTDSLFMDIVGGSPKFHLQGYLIRFFMNVKENYFGEDLHFRTLEEYQDRLGPTKHFVAEDQRRTVKKDNDLDVILNVRAEDSCVLMPANIYRRDENVQVDVMLVEADMRFTNYYMDLQVDTSPIEVSTQTTIFHDAEIKKETTGCQLFIDTVSVYGHRLFGAPPTEPTYVCNWDFDVGSISGECSTPFLKTMVAAIQAFIFTLDDDENALPITRVAVLNDVTFLRARVGEIKIWIIAKSAGFLLETGRATISFDDWAGRHFSKSLKAYIPSIVTGIVDTEKIEHHHSSSRRIAPTLACIKASFYVVNIDRKAEFEHERFQQQHHVKFHDMRTYRADCLVYDDRPLNVVAKETQWSQDPPAMPVPDLPVPLNNSGESVHALSKKSSRLRNQHQKSFLSRASSSSARQAQTQNNDRSRSRSQARTRLQAPESNGKQHHADSRPNAHGGSVHPADRNGTRELPFSSPWIGPRFSLQSVELDLSHMPSTYASNQSDFQTLKYSGAEEEYNDSDEPIPHGAVFCDVPDGVHGFCSPLAFPVIIDLLQDIMPSDSHSLLDGIQQKTVSNIKTLTTEQPGEKFDFAIRIPAAAIRLTNVRLAPSSPADVLEDQYDLVLSQARLSGRIAPTVTRQTHSQTKGNILLLQASISGTEIHVTEILESKVRHGASVQVSILDNGFWLSLQDKIRTKLQLGSLKVATGRSTVDRLSMLAERSRIMVTKIIEDFEKLDLTRATQHLVYHLSLLNTQTADPVFLSKPSYVLRSATDHVRLADSWKVVSRLRQRLLAMTPEQQKDLIDHRSCMFERQHDKARQQILEAVDHWQTWDRDHEACGPVLAAVFGKAQSSDTTTEKIEDLEIGVYLGQISIVLDPGPQQNELLLQSGDFNFSQQPVFERDTDQTDQKVVRRSKIRVQLWFADMTLDINWNLIDLARSLVSQMNIPTAVADTEKRRNSAKSIPQAAELDLMVVAGTDLATIKIGTPNIKLHMAARELKTSAVVQRSRSRNTVSLLLASSTAQLKMASEYERIFNWKLRAPTIYTIYQQNEQRLERPDTVRIAASCDRLRFEMKQDVLSVLGLVDTVINEEATVIVDLVNAIEEQKVAAMPDAASEPIRLEDVHVAFFLNNYKLHFCLLPTLQYSIIGMVARTSIVPRSASKFAIHMDVKKNTHTLIGPGGTRRRAAARFEIPPLGGQVTVGLSEEWLNVNAGSTLEQVTIEASAVQACVEAVYRPENVQRIKEGKVLIEKIQRSVRKMESIGNNTRVSLQPTEKIRRVLLYSGHAVFEGLEIHCSAPAAHSEEYRADLKVGIRQTTLRIQNHHRASRKALNRPQVELNLRQIFVDLSRRYNKATRRYGHFSMGLRFTGITEVGQNSEQTQDLRLESQAMQLDLYTETVPLFIDVATFLQGRITEITTAEERNRIKPLRRLTLANNEFKAPATESDGTAPETAASSNIFDTTFSLDLNAVQVRLIITEDQQAGFGRTPEDLVFSIRQIDLRTQRESSAKLTILDMQLQTVSKTQVNPVMRSANSALLPEMIFNAAHFSTRRDRRFAFQAAGKALDLKLAADGIVPLSTIQRSIARATADLRNSETMQTSSGESTETRPVTSFLGNKSLASLLIDADFAGAVFRISPQAEKADSTPGTSFGMLKGQKRSRAGRYGQAVQSDGAEEAVLRAPGIAVKVEYLDAGSADPTLSTEIKVAASSNTLAPSVVPLVREIYSSVKEIIGDDSPQDGDSQENAPDSKPHAQRYLAGAANTDTDPTAILGRVKLDAVLWVQKQEFSLTCQPIARVAATARFEEIFVTINTVQDGDHERFFSIITSFNKLQTSVQHVYSRESTASFEVDSIVMSLMNSKHISTKNGISAILNISPIRASLNAKQMQDFMLFREIWYPTELRQRTKPPTPAATASESQAYAMQRYHELAETAALPWHAVVSIHELKLEIDFGQSLGKSSFMVSKLWASSKKNSDSEQNLCIGFDRIGIDSSGRMSGFIELKELRARTSIRWPMTKDSDVRAPLVQASIGFGHLRLKAAFDYQPFAVIDISSFEFLMYNLRPTAGYGSDRLVGILNGGKVQVFCVSTAAAQALSIVQAFERLLQEKRDAFKDSLQELDRLLRRKSIFPSSAILAEGTSESEPVAKVAKRESHRLHTDVVVTLKVIDIGAFPNTFFDSQILRIEAVDAQARFAVSTVEDRVRSGLGMTLGQVRVALSAISRANTKALGEVEIDEVVERATTSRGGTILKVPRLVAKMQTWQMPQSSTVEYIFRSTFQGKVDVGWNYSRISFIRGMWETHSQALAHRLGKPLPPAAVKITAEPQEDGSQQRKQEKITAVVNMPQSSKFQYVALEPPVIDTPQLRDMGEATPPLEWIGLHRDKLPNVTHSIVIVTLLEVAKEVEDAYTKILGSG